MEVYGYLFGYHILQNILFFAQQKKETQVWNNLRRILELSFISLI